MPTNPKNYEDEIKMSQGTHSKKVKLVMEVCNGDNVEQCDVVTTVTGKMVTDALNYTPINKDQKRSDDGVAALDNDGKIYEDQLPDSVEDWVLGYKTGNKFYTTKNADGTYSGLVDPPKEDLLYIDISPTKENKPAWEIYGFDGTSYQKITNKIEWDEDPVKRLNDVYNWYKGETCIHWVYENNKPAKVENNTAYTYDTTYDASDGIAIKPNPNDGNRKTLIVNTGVRAVSAKTSGVISVNTNGTPKDVTVAEKMTGATASAAGKVGLVPAPAAGKQASFLRGDGTWVVPTDNKVTQTNTTTNAGYRIALSTNANDTTETNTIRKSSKFTANPSTGVLSASIFKGNLNGVADRIAFNKWPSGYDTGNADYPLLIGHTIGSSDNDVDVYADTITFNPDNKRLDVPNIRASYIYTDEIESPSVCKQLQGATDTMDGEAGYVPAPPSNGYNMKYLRADGSWSMPQNIALRGTCDTYNDIKNKSVNVNNFIPIIGSIIYVQFLHGNQVENVTLNVNGTGDIPITYAKKPIPSYLFHIPNNYRETRLYMPFMYMGNQWEYLGDYQQYATLTNPGIMREYDYRNLLRISNSPKLLCHIDGSVASFSIPGLFTENKMILVSYRGDKAGLRACLIPMINISDNSTVWVNETNGVNTTFIKGSDDDMQFFEFMGPGCEKFNLLDVYKIY